MSEEKDKSKKRVIDVNVRHTYGDNPEKTEKSNFSVDPRNVRIEGKTLDEILKEKEWSEKEASELREKFEAVATAEFQRDKKEIIARLSASGRFEEEELESEIEPTNIETWRKFSERYGEDYEEKEKESKPPKKGASGVVGLNYKSPVYREKADMDTEGAKMVRELYLQKRFGKTRKEREDADKKIKILWNTLFRKMKELPRKGRGVPKFTIMECPECGEPMVDTTVCPSCGYDTHEDKNRPIDPEGR